MESWSRVALITPPRVSFPERTNLTLAQPSGSWSQGYAYDSAKRLSSVTSPAGSFGYTYSTGVGSATSASMLWKKLALFGVGSAYITNIFDGNARLSSTALRNNSAAELNIHEYLYNLANQRTKQTRTDDSYVDYTYDPIGQLESAKGYTSGGSVLSTDTKGYKYDASQNMVTRTNNTTPQSFNVNVRNEPTSFSGSYDANGNLTSDSSRTYVYDDETGSSS